MDTHHFILTTQAAQPSGGFKVDTWQGTCNPEPGATRVEVYESLRAEHERQHPGFAGGALLFFSLEPNQL